MTMLFPALLPVGAFLLRRGLPLLVLLVTSVTLLGCQPSIEVVQPNSPLAAADGRAGRARSGDHGRRF